MRLRDGARVAVIGAGPSGLVAAKHALEAGFDVTVFEASDALGGQWHTTAAAQRGVAGDAHEHEPGDDRVLRLPARRPSIRCIRRPSRSRPTSTRYARAFGVADRIRFGTPVEDVRPGWTVDGEPFDAVVVASGRFRKPRLPPVVDAFRGEVIHAFDYPGAAAVPRPAPRSSTATGSAAWRSRPTSRRTRRSSPRSASRAT